MAKVDRPSDNVGRHAAFWLRPSHTAQVLLSVGGMLLGTRLVSGQGTKGSAECRLPPLHALVTARPPQDGAERPTLVRRGGTLAPQGGRQVLRLVPPLHNVYKLASRQTNRRVAGKDAAIEGLVLQEVRHTLDTSLRP